MTLEHSIALDGHLFPANIRALAARQPDLARQVERIGPPAGARIVTGRDGWPVALLTSTASAEQWLGGSSMPSVSVPAVLAGFVDRGCNVALDSVGTGHEPKALAERIPGHCAVFVCEPDVSRIAAALAVSDVADLIERGRLVFIGGPIQEGLYEYLTEHDSCECPAQVWPLGNLTQTELGNRTAAIERAGRNADEVRRQRFAALSAELAARRPKNRTERPKVLVLSTDTIGGAVELAAQLESALARLGWSGALCVPDRPDHCGLMARLTALRDADPDVTLFLNCTPGDLAATLPAGTRYACWFLESAALAARALEGLDRCELLLAASVPVRTQLLARRARPEAVRILETGVDEVAFHPLDAAGQRPAGDFELAVFCDGTDTSTEASNIGLESHARLWTELTRMLEEAALHDGRMDVDELLRKAERQTKVRLSDAELRGHFLGLAASRLPKTIACRTIIEKLQNQPGLAIWGSNWQSHSSVGPFHRGPIPGPARRNVIYNTAKVLLLPFPDPPAVRHILEALAAGCCPVVRTIGPAQLKAYPQSCEILGAVPSGGTLREISVEVSQLVNEGEKRKSIVKSLQTAVLANNKLSDRLRVLADLAYRTSP